MTFFIETTKKCYGLRKTLHILCWEHQVIAEWENLGQASDALVFELVEARGLLAIPKEFA